MLALDGSRSPCAIGIEELLDEDLRVHPVPAHDRFTVRWEAPDEEMDLVLWSVGGRPLRRVRSRNGAIMEVGDLPAGSYILTLTGASGGRASHPVILVGTP